MKRTQHLIQAYRQAPWRRQLQMIGLLAASFAFMALIAWVYLDISARASTIGRSVQNLQEQREDLEQEIEDLESQLASLTSVESMQARAVDLGFEAISPGAITYLVVPGYVGRAETQLAPRPGSQFAGGVRLPATYTESLFVWLGKIVAWMGAP
jgi:cell division protein FtsB